jgi:hypothetical protein
MFRRLHTPITGGVRVTVDECDHKTTMLVAIQEFFPEDPITAFYGECVRSDSKSVNFLNTARLFPLIPGQWNLDCSRSFIGKTISAYDFTRRTYKNGVAAFARQVYDERDASSVVRMHDSEANRRSSTAGTPLDPYKRTLYLVANHRIEAGDEITFYLEEEEEEEEEEDDDDGETEATSPPIKIACVSPRYKNSGREPVYHSYEEPPITPRFRWQPIVDESK